MPFHSFHTGHQSVIIMIRVMSLLFITTRVMLLAAILSKLMPQNRPPNSPNRQPRSTHSKQLPRITILLLLLLFLLLGIALPVSSVPLSLRRVLRRVPRRRRSTIVPPLTHRARGLATTVGKLSGEVPLRASR
ncbi:hypothetical protein BJY04DRAFT_197139 [Aspergillus karnatakaensis]|uniref:uncharacterized protein n=1 Tax=Aspergillus karnatakaensis TaxID=1810916 RepID=UPI003CCCB660